MSLVNCPDCGEPVSTRAKACPRCAHPINPSVRPAVAAPSAPRAAPHVQTIERTSKTLKGQIVASVLLVFTGVLTTCGGMVVARETEGGSGAAQIGLLMFVGGTVWFIATRIRIWWHHD
jgi:hypothetical protein